MGTHRSRSTEKFIFKFNEVLIFYSYILLLQFYVLNPRSGQRSGQRRRGVKKGQSWSLCKAGRMNHLHSQSYILLKSFLNFDFLSTSYNLLLLGKTRI